MKKSWRAVERILDGAIQPKILKEIITVAAVLSVMVLLGLVSPAVAFGFIAALLNLYITFILPDWFKFLILVGAVLVLLAVVILAVVYILKKRSNRYLL